VRHCRGHCAGDAGPRPQEDRRRRLRRQHRSREVCVAHRRVLL